MKSDGNISKNVEFNHIYFKVKRWQKNGLLN